MRTRTRLWVYEQDMTRAYCTSAEEALEAALNHIKHLKWLGYEITSSRMDENSHGVSKMSWVLRTMADGTHFNYTNIDVYQAEDY